MKLVSVASSYRQAKVPLTDYLTKTRLREHRVNRIRSLIHTQCVQKRLCDELLHARPAKLVERYSRSDPNASTALFGAVPMASEALRLITSNIWYAS